MRFDLFANSTFALPIASWLPDDWGGPSWLLPVGLLAILAIAIIAWSYLTAQVASHWRVVLSLMKLIALALLLICLLEPLERTTRPEKGANVMIVMADDSQSLQIKDRGQSTTRGEQLRQTLDESSSWLSKLVADFDVRRYQVDQRLQSVSSFENFVADQRGSSLLSALEIVSQRFTDRPAAGVMLFTDGNLTGITNESDLATALEAIDWTRVPPVFPIVLGDSTPAKDLGITRVSSTQTNFETAPVTVTAELVAHGYDRQRIVVQLLDESNVELERKEVAQVESGRPFSVRFKTTPQRRGVNFFRVNAFAANEEEANLTGAATPEATLLNNQRLAAIDRGRGPFRILYVSGRPNWELKFLRRALQSDPELDMVALVRIAKRAAKFSFRGREGQDSNSLFRGFASQDDDTTERMDEAVFTRIGTRDEQELSGGFPKTPEELFEYDAMVLDDVEAAFFSESQKALVQQFVTSRGGGLLMLGGQESFAAGGYDRTPIGELLPVYLDRSPRIADDAEFRLSLTREGWLQPWVRLAATETLEQRRLATMPGFRTVNLTDSIKPGASVLASVVGADGKQLPALVVQPFGKGRAAALLIGDLWRWHLRSELDNDDLFKSWRQTMRWLVAEVPRRLTIEVIKQTGGSQSVELKCRVLDDVFQPFDNASVAVTVETPAGKKIELTAEASATEPGVYVASFVSSDPGAYRATVAALAADGSPIESREAGWVAEPDRDEFRSLVPNRELLQRIADLSGGELVELTSLDSFVESLDRREVPITETRTFPWWHRWPVFALALSLLVAEWGVRRWKGLP